MRHSVPTAYWPHQSQVADLQRCVPFFAAQTHNKTTLAPPAQPSPAQAQPQPSPAQPSPAQPSSRRPHRAAEHSPAQPSPAQPSPSPSPGQPSSSTLPSTKPQIQNVVPKKKLSVKTFGQNFGTQTLNNFYDQTLRKLDRKEQNGPRCSRQKHT